MNQSFPCLVILHERGRKWRISGGDFLRSAGGLAASGLGRDNSVYQILEGSFGVCEIWRWWSRRERQRGTYWRWFGMGGGFNGTRRGREGGRVYENAPSDYCHMFWMELGVTVEVRCVS